MSSFLLFLQLTGGLFFSKNALSLIYFEFLNIFNVTVIEPMFEVPVSNFTSENNGDSDIGQVLINLGLLVFFPSRINEW